MHCSQIVIINIYTANEYVFRSQANHTNQNDQFAALTMSLEAEMQIYRCWEIKRLTSDSSHR